MCSLVIAAVSGVMFYSPNELTFAPLFINNWAISKNPLDTAIINGASILVSALCSLVK